MPDWGKTVLGCHGDGFSRYGNDFAAQGNGFSAYVNGFAAHGNDFSAHVDGFAAHGNDFSAYVDGFAGYVDDFAAYGNGFAGYGNGFAAYGNDFSGEKDSSSNCTVEFCRELGYINGGYEAETRYVPNVCRAFNDYIHLHKVILSDWIRFVKRKQHERRQRYR
jgi:hypothetical protein